MHWATRYILYCPLPGLSLYLKEFNECYLWMEHGTFTLGFSFTAPKPVKFSFTLFLRHKWKRHGYLKKALSVFKLYTLFLIKFCCSDNIFCNSPQSFCPCLFAFPFLN